MKSLLRIITIFLFPLALSAQNIDWEEITQNYSFPDGVKLFHGTIASDTSFLAYYYKVDLSFPNVAVRPYIRTSPQQVHTFTGEVGAYAAINGGFFAGTSSVSSVVYPTEVKAINITSVVRSGKTYPLIRPVFALNNDRSLTTAWVYHHSYQLDDIYVYEQPLQYACDDPNPLPVPLKADGYQYDNIAYGLGGGPQLIKNGEINITYCEEVFWGSGVFMTDYRPRTAVGYTGDQKVIMFVTNHMMIEQVAETLLGLGCYEAINLDGGGSSAIAAGNQSLYDQARAVPTILAIVHSDSLNIPKVPTFEKFIDTSDEGVTSQGSWFPTSNPGSWGSPSMLHGLATHDQYFNFPLNLPAAAEYEIHAWWTSHPNRSANTPFFISHADGVTEVAVNQTTNGSVWNLIGTFSFTGNTLESVRITAGATTNQYVVADAIRVVSYDTLVNVSVFSPTKSDISVKIYPNPGTGLFKVQDQKNSAQNIFIYSTDGRLIHSSRLTGLFEHEVDLSRQPAGIYFLRLSDSETNRFYKLIISR